VDDALTQLQLKLKEGTPRKTEAGDARITVTASSLGSQTDEGGLEERVGATQQNSEDVSQVFCLSAAQNSEQSQGVNKLAAGTNRLLITMPPRQTCKQQDTLVSYSSTS
jgi:hypothetical protein